MAPSPLETLQAALASGTADPARVAHVSLAHADGNALHNTYLHLDSASLFAQAKSLPSRFLTHPPLYSVPISLKDCFDLANTVTTAGSRFYAAHNAPAEHDSAVAERLRTCGCLITGKTHLHPLAYGITGQNADYGDCLQPRDRTLLTGGSSSGAAASVQEGSALAAIGTDTGGSIRVPAALCGLVGFRASQTLPQTLWPGMWQGAAHLAPTFDTLGLLFKDLRDATPLIENIFGITPQPIPATPRIGCVAPSFLHDCEPEVLAAYEAWKHHLRAAGLTLEDFEPDNWQESLEIFAGIQAHEAAALHHGHFHHFEAPIAQRLAWGESIPPEEIAVFRERHAAFNTRVDALFERFDFLMLPASPVSRLRVGADQSAVRQAILRYTTPFSLAGLPTFSLPGEAIAAPFGTGIQLSAPRNQDGTLLTLLRSVPL